MDDKEIIGYGLSDEKGLKNYINGELVKEIINNNIDKNLKKNIDKIDLIKEEIWGYTFKIKGDIIFKLVDEKLKSKNKYKGTILKNISNKQKLICYIKEYFPKYYNDDINKKLSKDNILLLIEFIIRNENKFIPYEHIYFKYL